MARGVFIVVDGIDGSGKSEMVKLLHNHLFSKSKKYRILTTREPTNGKYGKHIREMLAKEEDPKTNAEEFLELFVNDREEHLNKTIIPFLSKSEDGEVNIVICDRYYYSSIAFQATQGLDMNKIIDRNKNFLKPDIAFIMDVKPEVALNRIKNRKKEKFEKPEFMVGLRKKFLELPNFLHDNIKIIDASKTPEEVFDSIRKELDALLQRIG
jgi:dTMP kinase